MMVDVYYMLEGRGRYLSSWLSLLCSKVLVIYGHS